MPVLSKCLVCVLGAALMCMSAIAEAHSLSGSYLAARHADATLDYEESLKYYQRALRHDRSNPVLLDSAMRAAVGVGDISSAVAFAQRYSDAELNALVELLSVMTLLSEGRFSEAELRLIAAQDTILPILSDLWRAWIALNTGEEETAFALFSSMNSNATTRLFARYHSGLAQITIGQQEAAAALLLDHPMGPVVINRDATRLRVELLAFLGRQDEALQALDDILKGAIGDEGFESLRSVVLASDPQSPSVISQPMQGFARALYDVASILGRANDEVALIYSRLATHLDPKLWEAWLLSAEILERQQQYDLAQDAYARIPDFLPQAMEAGIGRAGVLDRAGRIEEALAVYADLALSHPESLRVHFYRAEALRRAERYEDAVMSYTVAQEVARARNALFWQLFNGRAVTHHLKDDWPAAEVDFRAALELSPSEPFVLNYLGYSLVERGEHLEEALIMIETAAAQEPDNGFITDSLGWVYFIRERYGDAVKPLERAVALEPVDPVINDHLGDAYWMVGRQREAEFQWNRALSFNPEPEDRVRILRKLELGLDFVRAEEAAAASHGEAPDVDKP